MKSGTPGLRANPRTGGARDGRVFRPAGRHAGAAAGSDDLVLGSVARSTESLRVADYAACCRLVARESEAMLDDPEAAYPVTTEPEPVRHCDCCRWGQTCRAPVASGGRSGAGGKLDVPPAARPSWPALAEPRPALETPPGSAARWAGFTNAEACVPPPLGAPPTLRAPARRPRCAARAHAG